MERRHNLQKATHAILGGELDISRNFTLNVEGYYKWFNQLSNINRNKLYNDDINSNTIPDELKKDFIIESGDAYGIDVVLKYKAEKLISKMYIHLVK